MDDIDRWFDELIRESKKAQAEKKRRRENPYALHLIKVLWPYPSGLSRQTAIDKVWRLRQPENLPMPKAFEQTVQSAFQQHASESSVFKGGPDDDLFFWPEGKGTGRWAVRRIQAEAWIRRRALPEAN